MDARLVEFAEVLRQNGLKVSLTETNDAARAVATIGLEDPTRVRATLKACLCKRAADVPTFDRAFDFYFTGAAQMLEGVEKSLLARIKEQGLLEGDDLTMLLHQMAQLAGGLSPLTQAMLEGDRGRLAAIFRQAALQLDFGRIQNALQTGFFSRRLLTGAGLEKTRADLQSLEVELQARGLSAGGVEIVSKHLAAALREVEDAARAMVQQQVNARLKKPSGGLGDRPLHTLSRTELMNVQRAVRQLAEKLKSRLVRRQRSRRKGTLNPRRTLRKNLSAGGVPMVPQFRTRRPQRPDVVVLCDISDSVRATSKMMLLFTWTLQSLFSRVRSFVFVSDVGEVTRHFKDVSPEQALETATGGDVISVASNSNYGNALSVFARGHLGSITRRTTVLVIGDGRNNYNPAHAWALEDVKRKARRVVWICTEPRQNWGFGDSEMLRYSRAVSQVVTVLSLNDLERAAKDLVPV